LLPDKSGLQPLEIGKSDLAEKALDVIDFGIVFPRLKGSPIEVS
jgi:hypothetical protein